MYRKVKIGLSAALALAVLAVPAAAQNFSGSYSFLKAVKERDGAKVESLLTGPTSAIVNAKDSSSGEGALHVVTRGRDRGWLAFLLGKGARADLQNKAGDTPLILASQLGWIEGIDLLLRVGANANMANNSGETPLMFAVRNNDIATVRLLMSKGADPKRTDSVAGYSALDYAKQNSRGSAVLQLLEARPAKPAREIAGPPR